MIGEELVLPKPLICEKCGFKTTDGLEFFAHTFKHTLEEI